MQLILSLHRVRNCRQIERKMVIHGTIMLCIYLKPLWMWNFMKIYYLSMHKYTRRMRSYLKFSFALNAMCYSNENNPYIRSMHLLRKDSDTKTKRDKNPEKKKMHAKHNYCNSISGTCQQNTAHTFTRHSLYSIALLLWFLYSFISLRSKIYVQPAPAYYLHKC